MDTEELYWCRLNFEQAHQWLDLTRGQAIDEYVSTATTRMWLDWKKAWTLCYMRHERLLATAKEDARCAWATARASDAARLEEMKKRDALQAKIDALMLEFCPNEITEEQFRGWARAQAIPAP